MVEDLVLLAVVEPPELAGAHVDGLGPAVEGVAILAVHHQVEAGEGGRVAAGVPVGVDGTAWRQPDHHHAADRGGAREIDGLLQEVDAARQALDGAVVDGADPVEGVAQIIGAPQKDGFGGMVSGSRVVLAQRDLVP